jgi:hypothetical protein
VPEQASSTCSGKTFGSFFMKEYSSLLAMPLQKYVMRDDPTWLWDATRQRRCSAA